MDAPSLTDDSTFCVVGGGIAGLVFARLLQRQRPDWAITVLDAGISQTDGKTIVIDRAAAGCLAQLEALPAASRAIKQVQISIGGFAGFGRKTLGDGQQALGYSISPPQVVARLQQGLTIKQAHLHTITRTGDGVALTTAAGDRLQARFLVAACPLAMLPPPFQTRRLPYRQAVLSLAAAGALPPATARQRFTRRRVLVLVPRADDDDIGVIICAASTDAGTLSALPDKALSAYLSKEFKLAINVHGRRFAYPPQLVRTRPLAAAPIFLLGSGASTLHPIGAQALSLAIADASQLAAAFASAGHSQPPARHRTCRRAHAHRQKALLTSTLALGAFGAGGLF